ncbi:N-terminal acetyltransferase A complex subunit nat1 [Sparassis crispa]|uniref:N-terminal acetyltransferase A complex subunit nat1 n=1 Tax=Sparassis crispa TaxID=139825 RepID=A0A401H3U4_9APHY|nr:N-terminal acetyltransferase A complex subunit nat1 [Sparassis crispa]GBE89082.1 N-terminal acetyltransferase A complex subunit nat1 [Sparassis crispa]
MPPSGIPAKRVLSSKEATLFKELLGLYEAKQLKKGLKTADQILKKFPEHGETLCMKGLILTHMGRREEGLDLVKQGIRLDLTSHICWHVFGLIQKGEKNYEEALKSYTQALRFDKENLNILRDAALLQTQLRNFDGLVETRHTLLRLRPTLRQHWIGLAVAYHLNGNLAEARKVLEHYESTLKNVPDYDSEHSETLVYHVRLLEDMGEASSALALLDVNAKSRAIIDRMAIMEFRARLMSKLGMDGADDAWQALIEQNPDCHEYYSGFLSSRGIELGTITDENREQAVRYLGEFSEQIPRASAPRRLWLNIAVGDKFRELVESYLVSGLEKGIPSLFSDVKALYADPSKQQVIEEVVEAQREKLAAEPASDAASEPTTYLWTLYFLAQHHSKLSRHTRAISLLDVAITHTPTLPELYMFKARVLKRCGDFIGAARFMDEARMLDLQDRFLNTKCAQYRLRANLVNEANDILGLFTKKDAPSPGADLEEMQSLLYLMEEADAHVRKDNMGLALKRYTAVQKVFDEFEDDQFDFHGYSIRHFTINAYLGLISWEDHLRSHPAYIHTALAASRIYIRLHDDPSLASSSTSTGHLTDAEKKAKKKAKKAAQKVHDETKKATPNAPSANEDKGLEPGPMKDDDPDGTKLLQLPDPLERAAKLVAPLSTLAKDNIDAWIAIYDVAVRRKKYLQAVKALNNARSLDSDHPELHIRLAHFRIQVSSLPQDPPAPIGPVVTSALARLLPEELSLEVFNSQHLQQHSTDAKAILAVAKVSQLLQATREEVENAVFAILAPDVHMDIKTALQVVGFLQVIKSPRTEEFRRGCDARFELSTVFKSPSDIAAISWNASAAMAEDTKVETEDSN